MKHILVTGGDGYLGRTIVENLQLQGQHVRVMSRKSKPESLTEPLEWQQADILTGDGIVEALDGIDVIVNCMSNPLADTYAIDVLGTSKLLATAKTSGVKHIVHISIIGIDRIISPYYQYKLGAELAVIESGIPYTIARISQFHGFVDYIVSALNDITTDEVYIPIDVKFQPMSPIDVAAHLAPTIIGDDAHGRLADFGGPQILTLKQIVQDWLAAQGKHQAIHPATESHNDIPFLGMFGDGFVQGYNTAPENCIGVIAWADYLQQTYT